MGDMTSSADIKIAIQLLETEQVLKGQLLKEQFLITYEGLKPINIIKSTIKDISSSPNFIDNIVGTATGIAGGYITKKIIVGTSMNMFRKLLGALVQFGVTNLIARHPDTIKTFSHFILQHVSHINDDDSKKPV
jgi:hypothetical protein